MMNRIKYLTPIILSVVASCSSKESAESIVEGAENTATNTVDLSYEVDTVMVDAGDQFLFLNWGLSLSDQSEDLSLIYNLNPIALLLEVIDLDSLKLKELIHLEKEGVNGVGNTFYQDLQVLDDGTICLMGSNKINFVSPSGELIKTLDFEHIKLKEDQRINYTGKFTEDGKFYVCVLENRDLKKAPSGIAIIDMETDSVKVIEMDLFRKLKEFEIKFDNGSVTSIATGDSFYLNFIENDLIISSSAFNDVYRYQIKNDILVHRTFNSTLTANERIANFPNEVDSEEQFYEVSTEAYKQVHFTQFRELTNFEMFWRISSELDRMIGDSVVYKQVITLFDEDFTMLKEKELINFYLSSQSFVKNRVIYSFLNIEDELAFVRLKPIITYE
tara:strand:- start:16804 stop:17967 length:1164 start_codon:yes stop_codon:yes gene_type:complete